MAAPNKFKIGDYVKFQDKPGLRLQPYVYTVLADLAIKDKKTKEISGYEYTLECVDSKKVRQQIVPEKEPVQTKRRGKVWKERKQNKLLHPKS